MKTQSFAKGAVLLGLAAGLGKIFSAIFKIPLDRFFLHEEGMAIFNSAYNVYMFFFAAATAGIPLAISALVAGAQSEDEEKTVLSTALISVCSLLLLFGVALFIFAPFVAEATGIPQATEAFRVISPALFFCGISAAFKGFFQGRLNMQPSALGQVSDSFGRLLLGFICAYIFINAPVHQAAARALWGVPFGAILCSFIFVMFFIKGKCRFHFSFSRDILKKIVILSLPITLTASMHQIFNLIDTVSVVRSLTYFSYSSPLQAFGCFSRAVILYALPVAIAAAVSQSVLPAVTKSFKENNLNQLNYDVSLAVRLATAVALPCSMGFLAVPREILMLLFDTDTYYTTLSLIALSPLFLSVGATLASVLQGTGKGKWTVLSAVCAILCKITLNPLLIKFMGVNGAPLATTLSYFVFSALLWVFVSLIVSIRLPLASYLAKMSVCGMACFFAAHIISGYVHVVFTIIITAIIYLPLLFISHFVTSKEIKQIFSSK